MIKLALATMVVLAACSGNSSNNSAPDAPAGPACTGAIFDNCTTNAQCMSQTCHYYQQSNFTVCTTTCSATQPCPADSSGNPASCNNMGICKPAAANNCHL